MAAASQNRGGSRSEPVLVKTATTNNGFALLLSQFPASVDGPNMGIAWQSEADCYTLLAVDQGLYPG